MNIVKSITFYLCSGLLLFACQSTSAKNSIETADLRSDFIKGMDVSMIPEIEALGGKYYQNGRETDPIQIFKSHGINYLRMRLWVNPYDESGAPYGGGNNDLEKSIAMAKRAHDNGMKYLLDLHYSDFWTDPGKQFKPKGWENLKFAALVDKLASYTEEVLDAHRKAGAMPDMVQTGNELNSGILWPDGKSWGEGESDSVRFERLAKLLKAATSAVRSQLGEEAQIMLHMAKGGDNGASRWWFDEITQRDVDFDIIGLSYYPMWDSVLEGVADNIADISKRYDKPVILVETSYPYTTMEGDERSLNNVVSESKNGYPLTVEGQASFMKDLMELVNNAPDKKGIGFFYWGGDWIPTPGATWATAAGMNYINEAGGKEGNAWENQALFDFEGNVLPSMRVFGN